MLENDHFVGSFVLPLNCDDMYHGVIRPDGVPFTAVLFSDELSALKVVPVDLRFPQCNALWKEHLGVD